MKIKVYAVISVLAVAVMAWPFLRVIMSPIGLVWLLPLFVSAFGLFWSACIMKNNRLAFVSGILLVCLAFGGGIFSWFALIFGSPNLMAISSFVAVVSGTLSASLTGMEDYRSRATIGEIDSQTRFGGSEGHRISVFGMVHSIFTVPGRHPDLRRSRFIVLLILGGYLVAMFLCVFCR